MAEEGQEKKEIEVQKSERSIVVVKDPIIMSLVKNCDEEFASKLSLTPKEEKQLRKYAVLVKYGDHAMIPMICTGERCICRHRCPLVSFKKTPLGKECPFERFAFNEWEAEYVRSLDIDLDDKVEKEQMRDLVESDILNARANVVLGDEGFIMQNPIAIDSDTGEVLERKEEHIALRLKERAQNRKDKVFKAFVARREDKLKSIAALKQDPTEIMANLRKQGEILAKKHKTAIDAEVVEKVDNNVEKKEENNAEEPF